MKRLIYPKKCEQTVLTKQEEDIQTVLKILRIWRLPLTLIKIRSLVIFKVFKVTKTVQQRNFASPTPRSKTCLGQIQKSISRRNHKTFKASFIRRKIQRLCDEKLFVFLAPTTKQNDNKVFKNFFQKFIQNIFYFSTNFIPNNLQHRSKISLYNREQLQNAELNFKK